MPHPSRSLVVQMQRSLYGGWPKLRTENRHGRIELNHRSIPGLDLKGSASCDSGGRTKFAAAGETCRESAFRNAEVVVFFTDLRVIERHREHAERGTVPNDPPIPVRIARRDLGDAEAPR